jgi:hypothetical protein
MGGEGGLELAADRAVRQPARLECLANGVEVIGGYGRPVEGYPEGQRLGSRERRLLGM